MADYWKSQPRRFCEICKCWFGDNKASIDFHERGRRHKQNVERHLREARQKTADKEKKDAETAKMLASIEEAATAAYQKDVLQKHGSLPPSQHPKPSMTTAPQLPTFPQDSTAAAKLAILQTIQEHERKRSQKKEVEIRESSPSSSDLVPPPPPSVWQQATTEEGHVYYYNVFTRATQWEAPGDLQPTQSMQESEEEEKDESAPEQPSVEAGQKRQAEEADVEQAKTLQPAKRRPHNPYGEWVTVSVRQPPEEEEEEGENGEESDSSSSSDDGGSRGGDDERTRFQERTVTSLPAEEEKVVPGSFKGFSFKKKPGRPQIRQRTSEL